VGTGAAAPLLLLLVLLLFLLSAKDLTLRLSPE
jgi:hypothetical protein